MAPANAQPAGSRPGDALTLHEAWSDRQRLRRVPRRWGAARPPGRRQAAGWAGFTWRRA